MLRSAQDEQVSRDADRPSRVAIALMIGALLAALLVAWWYWATYVRGERIVVFVEFQGTVHGLPDPDDAIVRDQTTIGSMTGAELMDDGNIRMEITIKKDSLRVDDRVELRVSRRTKKAECIVLPGIGDPHSPMVQDGDTIEGYLVIVED